MTIQDRYEQLDLPAAKALFHHSFDGYYWYSDQDTPETVVEESIDPNWFTRLPFVVEAHFYCEDQQMSLQVRNIDGEYRFAKIDLSGLPVAEGKYDQHEVIEYFAHRTNEHKKYRVVEAWQEVDQAVLHGTASMTTLQPAWSAFCGFR